MKKQLQFELWRECNSKCKFCYLGRANNITPDEIKIRNLDNVMNIMSDLSIYEEYDTIAFIGGEFFQGQMNNEEVRIKFFNLMKYTAQLLNDGIIKHVWMYATLTIGDQRDLYDTLKIFENTKGDFWILTSYDTIGRFHTQKMEDNWSYHMKNIHTLYPNIQFNITTIITGDLIEKYLNNTFSFKSLEKDYHSSLFIKLCALPEKMYKNKQEANDVIGNFFPTRESFLKFLIKIKKEDGELYDKLFNIKYRADTLYCEYEGEITEMTRNKENGLESFNPNIDHIMDCGHLSLYSPYIDSNKCALCDKIKIESVEC